jgi:hypothetical protein
MYGIPIFIDLLNLDELTPYKNRLMDMKKIIKYDEENKAIAEPHLKLLNKKLISCGIL